MCIKCSVWCIHGLSLIMRRVRTVCLVYSVLLDLCHVLCIDCALRCIVCSVCCTGETHYLVCSLCYVEHLGYSVECTVTMCSVSCKMHHVEVMMYYATSPKRNLYIVDNQSFSYSFLLLLPPPPPRHYPVSAPCHLPVSLSHRPYHRKLQLLTLLLQLLLA